MIQEDLFHRDLDDPRVNEISVGQDEKGGYAHVEICGTKKHVHRIVGDDYDVESLVEMANEPTMAMIRPRW